MKSWLSVACLWVVACGGSEDPGKDRVDASVMPGTTGDAGSASSGGGKNSTGNNDGNSGAGNSGTGNSGAATAGTGNSGSDNSGGATAGSSAGTGNSGGATAGGSSGVDADGGEPPAGLTDYREPGPQGVTNEAGTFTASGCSFAYEAFRPAAPATNNVVLLAPGFALLPGAGSSREAMIPFAKHIASWGITTYTVALCTNGALIDHAANAAAMAQLGDSLAPAKVLYAGFSAGGLGTVLAAAQAKGTAAFFGLDAVDRDAQAVAAIDALQVPRYAVVGEPSSCNDNSNMLPVYASKPIRVIKIVGAQHFVFEGSVCEGLKCLACDGGTAEHVTAVRALTTAFARHVFELDSAALAWWDPAGEGFKLLSDDGLISNIQ
jgi:hypothetical protein